MRYTKPEVVDYGTLVEMTQMQAITGLVEDSNIKVQPFHHFPPTSVPSNP